MTAADDGDGNSGGVPRGTLVGRVRMLNGHPTLRVMYMQYTWQRDSTARIERPDTENRVDCEMQRNGEKGACVANVCMFVFF